MLSGAERLILRLACHVASMDHSVTVLCHEMHASCRALLGVPGVSVVQTGRRLDRFRNRYLNAPFDYFSSLSLLPAASDRAATFVFFGPALPALWWWRRLKRRRSRCLYFCYEPPRFIYRDRREILDRVGAASVLMRPGFAFYRWLDRVFVGAADGILTQGAFGRSEIERVYGKEARIIPHGPELGYVERPARETFTVLTVNYLHPRKRIELFLRTMRELIDRGCPVRGVIAGDGPERTSLEKVAVEIGVAGSVRFAGFRDDAGLAAEYSAADAYLHTARLESFGLSVLDALSSGLPVVSVDEGGPTEMIGDGESGFLAPATPADLATRLMRLAESVELRLMMGRAAAASVRPRYGWELGARALLDAALADDARGHHT